MGGLVMLTQDQLNDKDFMWAYFRTRLKQIANARIEDFKNPDGSFKPMNEWPEDAVVAVSGFTAIPGTNKVLDVQLADPEPARQLLARMVSRPSPVQ